METRKGVSLALKFLIFAVLVFPTAQSCQTIQKQDDVLQANQYAKDGLWREAAELYKKVLAEKPNYFAAHRNLGMVLVKLGDYNGGTEHLKKSFPKYQNNFDANYYLAEAYRGLENYADAIFYYQKALKLRPNDQNTLRALSWSYFQIRFYSEAMATTKKLLRLKPDDEQAHIIMIRTLLKLNRSKMALKALNSAKRKANQQTKPFFNSVQGDIYYGLGKIDKAFESYRLALKEQPLLAGALLGLGKCLLAKNNPEKAIEYVERAVRVRPRLAEGFFILAQAYEGIDVKKSIKYHKYFNKLASTDPDYLEQITKSRKKLGFLMKSLRKKKDAL